MWPPVFLLISAVARAVVAALSVIATGRAAGMVKNLTRPHPSPEVETLGLEIPEHGEEGCLKQTQTLLPHP
jgi:hypothetical protein